MATAAFEIKEVFSAGWEGFKKNWVLLLGLLLISFFASIIVNVVFSSFLPQLVVAVLGFAVSVYIMLSNMKAVVAIINGETPGFDVLKNDLNLYLKFLAASIILMIIFMISSILFIIPVFLALAIFFPVQYMLVDKKDMPIMDVFKRSWKITTSQFLPCLLFILAAIVIAIIAAIVFVLPLLIAIPVIYIAGAAAYKKLDAAAGGDAQSTPSMIS